jgi:hypothetical protein
LTTGAVNIATGAYSTVKELVFTVVDIAMVSADTVGTIVGSPIGWNEWSSQGQSFQDATTLGTMLNAGRAGLGGGTLGMSEIVISTYNYIQDGDAEAFQQHLGGVSLGNLMGAAGAKLTTLKPNATTKPYLEICTEQQNKIPANIRNCFLAGTLVSKYSETEINNVELVPIEQIKFGDKVWSFNFSTLQWKVKPVLQTFRTQYDGDIVTINIGDDIIHSTGGHPFWVIDGVDLEDRPVCDCLPDCDQVMTIGGRWVYAKDLQVGDIVQSRSFGKQKISALEIFVTKTLVYNFLVDDLHNYCVGKNETLVHNTNNAPKSKVRKPGLSGKESANDVPSFARGKPSNIGETPAQYAERLMIERYGDKWRKVFKEKGKLIEGPKSEFNKIKKAFRGFIEPK